MSEAAGLVNVYVCETCSGHTITKNRDEGTTPFLIGCRATARCTGMAESSFYRVNQAQEPMLLWIKPTPDELKLFLAAHRDEVADQVREHVRQGGLLDVPVIPPAG